MFLMAVVVLGREAWAGAGRLCAGRNQEAAVIFLFGLESIFRRVSCLAGPVRLLFSFPTNRWPLLALTINKPVSNSLLGARILKHFVEAE